MAEQADAIIVGAGLAGLVAAAELGDTGKRVVILEQEGENSLGGQAFWSLGGLFFVDSPEQRHVRVRDSRELALQDWLGSAQFDRPEDFWPRKVAEAFVDFAAGEMRPWLHAQGMRWFPVVGWAERGGGMAHGHGNSVPRFHLNADRMWHYTEGVRNFAPIWPNHGIRILPGPSSLWFDARGNRLPAPCLPGFDTLGTLKHILSTGHDYSWFVLTQKIIRKEFALSGSEQNPDMTSKSWLAVLKSRRAKSAPPPVETFKEKGEDFIVRDNLRELVAGMNALTGENLIDHDRLRDQIEARDREVDNPFSKDAQITAIRGARNYLGDRLIRTVKPHRILDPANGPLIAVRLHVLTRKTLGGLHINLDSQVLDASGEPVPGLYAAGEVAGFGGGGYHGYNALEGTFLGGCIFSGRKAGRHAAK